MPHRRTDLGIVPVELVVSPINRTHLQDGGRYLHVGTVVHMARPWWYHAQPDVDPSTGQRRLIISLGNKHTETLHIT